MADKQTIGITTLITLLIITGASVGPGFFETQKYYCEDESSIVECPGNLSGGQGTRCYLNEEKDSWDYCSTGWIPITNDLKIQEQPIEQEQPTKSKGKVYNCDQEGCVVIN